MKKFAIFAFLLVLAAPMNNIALAKLEITNEHIKSLGTFIDITKTLGIALPSEIKKILNTTTSSASTGANITYGILLLSATSELELMDMIMSQRYKQLSDKYFNSILNQHNSLFKHVKGTGSDLASFVPLVIKSASIQAALSTSISPISALALNTFSITDNTITALLALNILNNERRYDAVWIYFDARRGGETHETAWFEASIKLGFLTKAATKNKLSLEQYFSTLWDKWGPYTTQAGVTENAKRQFKAEMEGLLAEATQEYTLAQTKKETASPLLFERLLQNIRALGKGVGDQIGKLADILHKLAVQIGSKLGATIATTTKSEQTPEETTEKSPPAQKDQQKPEITQLPQKTDKPVIPPQPQSQETLPETPPATEEIAEVNKQTEELEKVTVKSKADKLACAIQADASPKLQSLMFNEIAWMGTSNSANDEWIELKNISRQEVTLANWQLQDKDGQIHFVFPSVTVQPQGFYLLERTDDTTLPDITADAIYKGGLSNSDEGLYLFDASCQLQDKVEANPKWPAGDAEKKIPMERTMDLQWRAAPSPSPRAENTKSFGPGVFFSSSTNTSGGGGSASNPVVYSKILITELQASPIGERFIELYNPASEMVDLSGWYIQRKPQSGTLSSLVTSSNLEGKSVPANGYFLIVRDSSSFSVQPDLVLNDLALTEHNTLLLKNPNGEVVDRVGFGELSPDFETSPASYPPSESSIARIWGSAYTDTNNNAVDFTTQTPTPKATNIQEGAPSDSEAPEVSFSALETTHHTPLFALSWSTPSSDIDAFSLTHTVSPSQNGIFLKYWMNESWTSWGQEGTNALTLGSTTMAVSLTAQDGLEYIFSITAKDAAGNESSSDAASTTVSLSKTVVMNEVAWAGTTAANTADEWIELYNNTGSPIDLAGWRLAADDGSPNITFESGIIASQKYFLLERTDDNTISDIAANWTGSFGQGGLNNAGEVLTLYNAEGVIIDQVDASQAWPAGNNERKQSMERIDSNKGATSSNWANNNLMSVNGKAADNITKINGTPGQQNSISKSQTALGNTTNFRLNEFDAVTLTLLGSPYTTTGQLTIPQNKTLTIEPGVIIRFENNTSKITVSGTLQALGTPTQNIKFTGTLTLSPWCGLEFNSTSQNSTLEHMIIERAAGCGGLRRSIIVDGSSITLKNSSFVSGDWQRRIYLKNSNSTIDTIAISGANNPGDPDATGILIEGGSPTITNSTFSDNHIGIYNKFPSGTPTITNNTFTGHTYPIKLSSSQATVSGNTASNNTYNAILLDGGATADLTLQADTIPYIVANSYTVTTGKTLTIQQGAIIKFAEIGFDGPTLTINGNLVVQGVSGNPVTFTTAGDNEVGGTTATGNQATPSWRRMLFTSGSTGMLDHVVIKRGGNSLDNEGMIQIGQSGQAQSPTFQLSNGTIQQTGKHALYTFDANITIENSSFEVPANSYAFRVQHGSCPTLTGITITGAGSFISPSGVDCPLP